MVWDAKATLGEGVCWDAHRQILYWVDILEKQVHIFNPATNQDRCIPVGQYVSAVVPMTCGDLALATHHGFASLNLETEKITPLGDPESHLPVNRFNDGKCDPAGRFWAGTMHIEAKEKSGALYRMDTDGSIHTMVEPVGISNGLAWSNDHQTMYFIDTMQYEMVAFDYDIQTGAIADSRTVIHFDRDTGLPDGMTIDEEGMLWVCFVDGGCVTRWNPNDGTLLQKIPLPATLTTNCAFGGPQLDTLYVSTCRYEYTDEDLEKQPFAGSLFAIKPGVRGIAATPFGFKQS